MIVCKCIHKFRNKNNNIITYRLQDKNGNILDIDKDALKRSINNNTLRVTNLNLTSDNRLIDKKEVDEYKAPESEGERVLLKARVIGLTVDELEVISGAHCYLIHQSKDTHILYIPSDIENIFFYRPYKDDSDYYIETDGDYLTKMNGIRGNLRVVGGESIENCCRLFSGLTLKSLDLTKFNPKIIKDTNHMFYKSCIPKIDLSNLRFADNIKIDTLFYDLEAKELNINNISKLDIYHIKHYETFNKFIPDIHLNSDLFYKTIESIVLEIELSTNHYFNLAIKVVDEQHVQLVIANKNKKISINKILTNSRALSGLLCILVNIEKY